MRTRYILPIFLFSLLFSLSDSLYAQTDQKKTVELGDSIYVINSLGDTLSVRSRAEIKKKREERRRPLMNEEQADRIFSSLFGTSKKLSNADSIIKRLDDLPPFGIYKDNFFIAGTNLFQTPSQWNSDAKFQVSIRHRLTNSTLPFKTYLYFTYTQKAFWDVFKESFPFRDLNYNPTIGLGKALIYKNRLLGYIGLQFEHESNGKDGDDSRSWNKISFTSSFILHDRWLLESDVWIPIVDGKGNKDIVKYSGWANASIEYASPNRKYILNATVTKRGGWNLNHNVSLNAAIRLFGDSNQFLFFEYYNGYGESMLDYKQYRQRLRAGFVIKPDFTNFF